MPSIREKYIAIQNIDAELSQGTNKKYGDTFFTLLDEIMDTPARTPEDLAVKIKLLFRQRQLEGAYDIGPSLFKDATRILAGLD